MNSSSNEVPASPRTWRLAVLGAVAAVVLIVGGAIGGAWMYSQSREDSAATSTAYWETSAGQSEMATKAKASITSHVASRGYFISSFGPPKYEGLMVHMWVDLFPDEEGNPGHDKVRMWFAQAFAAGDDRSVAVFGPPKVAMSEGEL